MRVYTIYGLHAADGVIRYVGKTTCLRRRLRDHLRHAKNRRTHKDNWILAVDRKVDYVVLDWTLVRSNVDALERKHIKLHKATLTNLTEGGDGSLGFRHSEETKAKFRARTDFNLEGLKRPEVRKRAAESRKGIPCKPEHKERMRQFHLGKKKSPEHCANISKGRTGIQFTSEQRRKIGEASRLRWQNPEYRKYQCAKLAIALKIRHGSLSKQV